ncbi:MAG: ATP-grasp domain-containing protein [Leptolyngbya sp. RL_3_1]|nr:ATP-grasp domain-containing protein [Leptolyngbya sp. RL_3_1]
MTIFNHDITRSTQERSDAIHLYSGRALGLSKPGDKVQMHPNLAAEWAAIAAHYTRVGLAYTSDIIWNTSVLETIKYPDHETSFYFFGDVNNGVDSASHRLFQTLNPRWCEVVEHINSKNNFVSLANTLGIAVPKTLCFDNAAAARACEALPFPCYVKPSVSDHGVGIARCANPQELATALTQLESLGSLQVQQEVNTSIFLNLQYRVVADAAEPLLASEQILDGYVHGGNRYPTAHEPWDHVQPMAQWLVDKGIKGVFGIDVAVVETGDRVDYVSIECNPRFNGSSYPTIIAHRLNIQSWMSATCPTRYRSLSEINLAELEYSPTTGKGVILVNWGTVQAGKISVLLAGSPEEQVQLQTQLQARLTGE